MNFYNVTRLAPGRAGMRAQINGILVSKIYDHAWFYCMYHEGQHFPLRERMGIWQWHSRSGDPIKLPLLPRSHSICYPPSLSFCGSAHKHARSLFPSKPKKKKKSPSKNVICCLLGRKGRINGKELIMKGKENNSSVCSKSLSLVMVSIHLS